MTHADVNKETKKLFGFTEALVRLSIGLEDSDDLINDLKNALKKV